MSSILNITFFIHLTGYQSIFHCPPFVTVVLLNLMIDRLKQRLAQLRKQYIVDPERTKSAVLVPLYVKNGEYYVLLIQRTDRVKTHKGQISFPGGRCEEADCSVKETALREAQEEIGLNPQAVTIIGELDDMATNESRYIISPVVGVIPCPYDFKVDEWETEEVIEMPLSCLADTRNRETGTSVISGKTIVSYTYRCGDKVIWGATARILKQLMDLLSES